MSAQILDGIATAQAIKADLSQRVQVLTNAGATPGLGTLLVGDDPGSRSYVAGKHRDCAQVGVASISVELPATASFAEIAAAVEQLNDDPRVTGFIVQLPLPEGIDEKGVLELIDPAKDADGLHPVNLGRLALAVDAREAPNLPLPCTPNGILALLAAHDISTEGKRVTVVGRGVTVGRPLGLMLTRKGVDATVTLAHSRTRDLKSEVARAEILVAAAGVPHLIQPDWVRLGAVVLDVGVTRVGTTATGRAVLKGDVAPTVSDVAEWTSPNPGGVGPMTRAMLVSNVVESAERKLARSRRYESENQLG